MRIKQDTAEIKYVNRQIKQVNISGKLNGGDDRVLTKILDDGSLLGLVADGATGVGCGYKASEALLLEVIGNINGFDADLENVLIEADQKIQAMRIEAETTGLLFVLKENELRWSSAGDSDLYILSSVQVNRLNQNQYTKPRIGNGINYPVSGSYTLQANDRVLVTSDGLLSVIPEHRLIKAAFDIKSIIAIIKDDGYIDDDVGFIYISEEL